MKAPSTRAVLAVVALINAAILGPWEAYTLGNPTEGDTISATSAELGEAQPFIPLAAGLLMGHLWWRSNRTRWAFIVGFIVGVVFWPLVDKARK